MLPKFEYGEAVRVIRNIRNDGTFPGHETGTLLVPRGSVGYVRDVGTFLQDQLVYSVHLLDAERVVGCREEDLQPAMDLLALDVRTEFATQGLFRDQIDGAPEQVRQIGLDTEETLGGGRPIEGDQDIDVASWPRISASRGAKQGQSGHAETPGQVRFVLGKEF